MPNESDPGPPVPWPLVALMLGFVGLLVAAAAFTGQWVFLILGIIALAAAGVPMISNRR